MTSIGAGEGLTQGLEWQPIDSTLLVALRQHLDTVKYSYLANPTQTDMKAGKFIRDGKDSLGESIFDSADEGLLSMVNNTRLDWPFIVGELKKEADDPVARELIDNSADDYSMEVSEAVEKGELYFQGLEIGTERTSQGIEVRFKYQFIGPNPTLGEKYPLDKALLATSCQRVLITPDGQYLMAPLDGTELRELKELEEALAEDPSIDVALSSSDFDSLRDMLDWMYEQDQPHELEEKYSGISYSSSVVTSKYPKMSVEEIRAEYEQIERERFVKAIILADDSRY